MKSVGIKWSRLMYLKDLTSNELCILIIRNVAPAAAGSANLITKQEILAHIVKANKTNEQEILIWPK